MGAIQLIRHAQASFGAADYDVLSDAGREQARVLGIALSAERASTRDVSGELERQRDTAELARAASSSTTSERIVDPGWNEFVLVDSGAGSEPPKMGSREFQDELNGMLRLWMVGDLSAPETYHQFVARVDDAFGRVVESTARGETVRVFTSAGPIAMVVSVLLSGGDSLFRLLNDVILNASVTTVLVGKNGPRLLSFNEHRHLSPPLMSFR